MLSELWNDAWQSLFAEQGHAPAVGLRAIAMLWVLWFHAITTGLVDLGQATIDQQGTTLGDRLAAAWWPLGFSMSGDTGVDFFLVISGFLLCEMQLRELSSSSRIHAARFYLRRWFRIVPAYASAMAVSMLANPNEREAYACPSLWWSNLSFMNNIWPVQNFIFGPACMVHTWSIAVEFQAYLITPPLILFGHLLSSRLGLPGTSCYLYILGTAWLLCVVLRHLSYDDVSRTSQPYNSTALRIAPYFAGGAAAVCVSQFRAKPLEVPGPRLRAVAGLASWLLLLVLGSFNAEPSYFTRLTLPGKAYVQDEHWWPLRVHAALGRPVVGLAVAYLLWAALTGHAPRLAAFLGWDGWRPIAALSYSVYLLQYIGGLLAWTPFFTHVVAPRMALERELPAEEWTGARMALAAAIVHGKLLFVLLGTLPLALANYVLVERPLMLHGRRVASMIPERCGAVYVDKAEALV
jgi:peptidoglycan/LPS O-acetylase OafA/YrhL